jgi:plastocyanin
MQPKRHVWMTAVLALVFSAGMAEAKTIQVTIDKMTFSPADIAANVGDTIEWVNNDVFVHTATVKGGFDISLLPKKSGSVVMKEAAAIDYYCRFHPNMKGRITVSSP